MNSTLIEIKPEEINFPCLMSYKKEKGVDGLVVLAKSSEAGTVVHPGNSTYKLGDHINNWNSFTNTSVWEKFPYKVSLSNSF